MSHSDQSLMANLVLRTMNPDDYAIVAAKLERISLEQNMALAKANEPVEYIHFPEGGIVSITAESGEDGRTEVGIVGREGFAGLPVLLGSDRSVYDTFVQVDGTTALRIEADAFRDAITQSASLQTHLLRYALAFITQSAHNTVSNARHSIEARLARWLLMCHDRVDGDEIRLTHEFMSMMISAQRTGVTVSLHILEGAGMISSKRARVIILDREKLADLAGDAYGTPEAEYRRLFGAFGKSNEPG